MLRQQEENLTELLYQYRKEVKDMNEKITQFNDKMVKSIDSLNSELVTIRAGRANPHVLDKIRVDYYGTPSTLCIVEGVP